MCLCPLDICKCIFLYAFWPEIPANLYDNEFVFEVFKGSYESLIWYLAHLKLNEIYTEDLSETKVNFWFYSLIILRILFFIYSFFIFGNFLRNDSVITRQRIIYVLLLDAIAYILTFVYCKKLELNAKLNET